MLYQRFTTRTPTKLLQFIINYLINLENDLPFNIKSTFSQRLGFEQNYSIVLNKLLLMTKTLSTCK